MSQNNDWIISCKSETIYVLDTSVLVYNPEALKSFGSSQLVIPMIVLEELDGLRKKTTSTGRNARQVIRTLNDYFIKEEKSDLNIKVQLHPFQSEYMGNTTPDNLILEVCIRLKENNPDKEVSLVTKDLNLGIKAKLYLVKTLDYIEEAVDTVDVYSGIIDITVEDGVFEEFFQAPEEPFDILPYVSDEEKSQLFPNIGVVLHKESSLKSTGLAVFKNKKLVRLRGSNRKVMEVRPRNLGQRFAMSALLDPDVKLITLSGRAGSGKTLLAVAAGLNQVIEDTNIYSRFVISRPTHPLKNLDIGFLPGSLDEKLQPWMTPIKDAVSVAFGGGRAGRKRYDELTYQNILEVEPLTHIRGRSMPDVYFLLDESQNLGRLEIKTIITRMAEGAKIILTGDLAQIDNPFLDEHSSGLAQVIELFKHSNLSAHVSLEKGERSSLASEAAALL